MTNELITKIAINAGLIVITIITGFLLHKSGKPYSNLLFTSHKLATIAFIVLTIMIIVSYSQNFGLKGVALVLISTGAFSILGFMVSGGAMNLDRSQDLMLMVHRVASAILIVSIGVLFFTFVSLSGGLKT